MKTFFGIVFLVLCVPVSSSAMMIGLDGEPIWAMCPLGTNQQCDEGFTVIADRTMHLKGHLSVENKVGVFWRESKDHEAEYHTFPATAGTYRLPYLPYKFDLNFVRIVEFRVEFYGHTLHRQRLVLSVIRDRGFDIWLVVSPFDGGV